MARNRKLLRNGTTITLAVLLGLQGCANTPFGGATSSGGVSDTDGGCNPAAMALIGGILGALAGGRHNRGAGAAVGAGVGALACVAWNYRTQQTKTAEQVNQAYRMANNGQVPTNPRVVTYQVDAAPSTISSGNPMVINSVIGIAQAPGGTPPVVEQEIVVGYDGKKVASARKQANAGGGAGEYTTSFTVKLPQGVPQGSYPVYTSLYVNGNRVDGKSTAVQVVFISGGEPVAMVSGKF